MGNLHNHINEQAFAAAATDFGAWSGALETLADETGSFGAILFSASDTPFPGLPMSERMKESHEVYFRDGWYLRDERYRGLPTLVRDGIFDDLDIMDADAIKRHPYYQEFLTPLGLSGFVGIKVASGDDLWCISLQRTTTADPFSPQDKRKLAGLSQQLSAAAAVARALGLAAGNGALEAFEFSGTASVLLNARGEVVLTNPAAERLLGKGVRIVGKRLVANDSGATATLDRALNRLLWNPAGAALTAPIALPRETGSPLLVYALKLSTWAANPFAPGRTIVVLVDPDDRHRPPAHALQASFGLTPAEARLASRLASGEGLDRIADELAIAKETARHHLKSIFAKTGVGRQAELVALFASLLR
jgi:DNA-binding CsgD family transcriptional regulator